MSGEEHTSKSPFDQSFSIDTNTSLIGHASSSSSLNKSDTIDSQIDAILRGDDSLEFMSLENDDCESYEKVLEINNLTKKKNVTELLMRSESLEIFEEVVDEKLEAKFDLTNNSLKAQDDCEKSESTEKSQESVIEVKDWSLNVDSMEPDSLDPTIQNNVVTTEIFDSLEPVTVKRELKVFIPDENKSPTIMTPEIRIDEVESLSPSFDDVFYGEESDLDIPENRISNDSGQDITTSNLNDSNEGEKAEIFTLKEANGNSKIVQCEFPDQNQQNTDLSLEMEDLLAEVDKLSETFIPIGKTNTEDNTHETVKSPSKGIFSAITSLVTGLLSPSKKNETTASEIPQEPFNKTAGAPILTSNNVEDSKLSSFDENASLSQQEQDDVSENPSLVDIGEISRKSQDVWIPTDVLHEPFNPTLIESEIKDSKATLFDPWTIVDKFDETAEDFLTSDVFQDPWIPISPGGSKISEGDANETLILQNSEHNATDFLDTKTESHENCNGTGKIEESDNQSNNDLNITSTSPFKNDSWTPVTLKFNVEKFRLKPISTPLDLSPLKKKLEEVRDQPTKLSFTKPITDDQTIHQEKFETIPQALQSQTAESFQEPKISAQSNSQPQSPSIELIESPTQRRYQSPLFKNLLDPIPVVKLSPTTPTIPDDNSIANLLYTARLVSNSTKTTSLDEEEILKVEIDESENSQPSLTILLTSASKNIENSSNFENFESETSKYEKIEDCMIFPDKTDVENSMQSSKKLISQETFTIESNHNSLIDLIGEQENSTNQEMCENYSSDTNNGLTTLQNSPLTETLVTEKAAEKEMIIEQIPIIENPTEKDEPDSPKITEKKSPSPSYIVPVKERISLIECNKEQVPHSKAMEKEPKSSSVPIRQIAVEQTTPVKMVSVAEITLTPSDGKSTSKVSPPVPKKPEVEKDSSKDPEEVLMEYITPGEMIEFYKLVELESNFHICRINRRA